LPQWVYNLAPGESTPEKALIEIEDEILLSNPYPDLGERDVEVFAAWFLGSTTPQIQAECGLGSLFQARAAVRRVITKIRLHYGLDPNAPIQIGVGDKAEVLNGEPPSCDQASQRCKTRDFCSE